MCEGRGWAGAVVCAASMGLHLSQVLIWFLIAGSVHLGETSAEVVEVSWMTGGCGGMSLKRGVR